MIWLKTRNVHLCVTCGRYEIEKVSSKWVVFFKRGDRSAIHKAKSLKDAKSFAERHMFRIA